MIISTGSINTQKTKIIGYTGIGSAFYIKLKITQDNSKKV